MTAVKTIDNVVFSDFNRSESYKRVRPTFDGARNDDRTVVMDGCMFKNSTALHVLDSRNHAAHTTKIVLLVKEFSMASVVDAHRSGVYAWCHSDYAHEELPQAMAAAAVNCLWISPRLINKPATEQENVVSMIEDLSIREKQVLDLIAQGQSNLKIAALLDISKETVKSHVRNIMCKLMVTRRSQLALKALA